MLTLVALVLPLCLDTFAMAAALGLRRLPVRARIRVGLLFAAFEGGMPLAGLLAGAQLGRLLGTVADVIAIGLLLALGVLLLVRREDDEQERAGRLVTAHGFTAVTLGLSVSLDELAMGFVLGLARVPLVPAVALIALQAFVAAQLGFAFGARLGERLREGAERAAGMLLVALAVVLAAARLAGFAM